MSRDHSLTLGNRVVSQLPFKVRFAGSPTVYAPQYFYNNRAIRMDSIVGFLERAGRSTKLVLAQVTAIYFDEQTGYIGGSQEPKDVHLLYMRRKWEPEVAPRNSVTKPVSTLSCLLRILPAC